MPAPATVDDFLTLVRKSGLVTEERMQSFLSARQKAGLPKDHDQMAGLLIGAGLLTAFQAKQLTQGRWRRFFIGAKYKLLELLGTGGMGAVYLCEHVHLHRLVALKVLPPDRLADPSALDRFRREARASAALIHPNIVHTYDFDEFEKLHFLVLEFVDGPSLQEIVGRFGTMTPERAVNYIWQACQGLQHAHESGLVHRDIKPGNLLLDRGGVVKVLDMGLARFFNSTRESDQVTQQYDEKCVLGTADYLAPEQAMRGEVDIRCDIYSLGGTLHYLLTGSTPFGDGTVAQKLLFHQTKDPQPLNEFRADVPAGVQAVLRKMMAKLPADRYQTPLDVADALEPWLADVPPPPVQETLKLSAAALGVGRVNGDGPRSPQPGSPTGTYRRVMGPLSGKPNSGPILNGKHSGRIAGDLADTADLSGGHTGPLAAAQLFLATGAGKAIAAGAGLIALTLLALVTWAIWPKPTQPVETTRTVPPTNPRPVVTSVPSAVVTPAAPEVLTPEKARLLPAGTSCIVRLRVVMVGGVSNMYLNTHADYKSDENFVICIDKRHLEKFASGPNPAEVLKARYNGKEVRASGVLEERTLNKDGLRRLALCVTGPEHLEIVGGN